jgi:hypothetical protein
MGMDQGMIIAARWPQHEQSLMADADQYHWSDTRR